MLVARLAAFFLLNVLIFSSWYLLFTRKDRLLTVNLLIAAVFSLAQIILTVVFIGMALKALTAANLAFLNGAISLALMAAGRRRRPRPSLWSDIRASSQKVVSIIRGALILRILAALVAASIVWLVFLGIIYPPVE